VSIAQEAKEPTAPHEVAARVLKEQVVNPKRRVTLPTGQR
jgi:hypothetical protein